MREAGEFRFVFFVAIVYAGYFQNNVCLEFFRVTTNLEITNFVTTRHGCQNIGYVVGYIKLFLAKKQTIKFI